MLHLVFEDLDKHGQNSTVKLLHVFCLGKHFWHLLNERLHALFSELPAAVEHFDANRLAVIRQQGVRKRLHSWRYIPVLEGLVVSWAHRATNSRCHVVCYLVEVDGLLCMGWDCTLVIQVALLLSRMLGLVFLIISFVPVGLLLVVLLVVLILDGDINLVLNTLVVDLLRVGVLGQMRLVSVDPLVERLVHGQLAVALERVHRIDFMALLSQLVHVRLQRLCREEVFPIDSLLLLRLKLHQFVPIDFKLVNEGFQTQGCVVVFQLHGLLLLHLQQSQLLLDLRFHFLFLHRLDLQIPGTQVVFCLKMLNLGQFLLKPVVVLLRRVNLLQFVVAEILTLE